MQGNLTKTYFALVSHVRQALALREGLLRASLKNDNPWQRILRNVAEHHDPYLGTDALLAHRLQRAATADDERDPLFRLVTSEDAAEKLAAYICEELDLSAVDVAALAKVHSLQEQRLSGVTTLFEAKTLVGIILAGGAFLASQVPRELVTYLGVDHGLYQVVVFFSLMIGVMYVLVLWIGWGPPVRRSRRELRLTRSVLLFCEAFQGTSGKEGAVCDPK